MNIVYGLVENIEYKPLRIQAVLPDMGGILSPWAQVLTARSLSAKTYDPPVKGEQVALLLSDNDETALCLGSVMSDVDNSPADDHRFVKDFDDGTRIEYDSAASLLNINAVGNMQIVCAGTFKVTAASATIDAPTTINGDTTIKGIATITKNAIIKGISFILHTHGGVKSGGSSTQVPS